MSTPPTRVARRDRVRETLAMAAQSATFLDMVRAADAARDARAYAQALSGYLTVLEAHPLHPGYHVQAAHMLKEIGQYGEAELMYRDAIALGAPAADVIEHLSFVAYRAGGPRQLYAPDIMTFLGADWIEDGIGHAAFELKLATSEDAAIILQMMYDEPDVSLSIRLAMLRDTPCLDDLMATVIQADRFKAQNGSLIDALLGRTAS